jgi:hypothetical protein
MNHPMAGPVGYPVASRTRQTFADVTGHAPAITDQDMPYRTEVRYG